jgi:ketosteroid isomerase-like protein
MSEYRNLVGLGLLAALITAPVSAHDVSHAAQAEAATVEPAARAAATSVDAFHAALARGDQTAAVALLADDALIFESGGAERSKAEYASHHLAADAAFAAATTRTVSRRSGHVAGNLAWIATESTTTGTFRDRPVNSVSTETMVLRRTGDTWRIVHIHWSSAKAK